MKVIMINKSTNNIHECQWCGSGDNVNQETIEDYTPELLEHYAIVNICLGCWQMHNSQMAYATSN